MERFQELWHGIERLVVLLFKACLCLYVLRCVLHFQIVSLHDFEHFLRVLVAFIFG